MTGHHVTTRASTVPTHRARTTGNGRPHVTTTHKLITGTWTSDVGVLEAAIDRFNQEGLVTKDCRVAFFEVEGDEQLHVNVTHQHPTKTPAGWAGPARVADGFVHNRRFGNAAPSRITRHIRDMVFAARR